MSMGRSILVTLLVLMAAPACATGGSDPDPAERVAPRKTKVPGAPRERRESTSPPASDPSVKVPAGYRRMAIGGVAPLSAGSAIVLVDEAGKRGLVLRGDGVEASPLALHLIRARAESPTRALLALTIQKLGGTVVAVRVDRLEDDVVFGSVLLAQSGELRELEARPSDALALGVDANVPVYVAEGVLFRAGVDLDKFDFRRLRKATRLGPATERDEVPL